VTFTDRPTPSFGATVGRLDEDATVLIFYPTAGGRIRISPRRFRSMRVSHRRILTTAYRLATTSPLRSVTRKEQLAGPGVKDSRAWRRA
jgi:hypothetical protein